MFVRHAVARSIRNALLSSVMIGALALAVAPAHAQSQSQVDRMEQQIRDLQSQLQTMREQVNTTQQQVQKTQTDVAAAPRITFTNGRPGWTSADGQNSVQLTGRLHFDVGNYLSVSRAGAANSLQDGVNARRARIGVLGKVMGDWNYALVADFGGSTDATPSSIIENAFISYNGFRPVGIDFGYMDVPWTLDEATSSNDIMFMERSSAQAIATQFGAGDARSALGVHSNDDRYWAGFYVTGPAAGASHSGSNMSQMAEAARGTYQVWQDGSDSIHLGLNGLYLSNPRNGAAHQVALSDRPELRIDSTTFLNTGAINADSGWVGGLEAAAQFGNFFTQGEYYHYNIDQFGTTPTSAAPSLDFDGGYIQASYSFGGRRKYNPGAGAYSGVIPDHPMDSSFTGWGAFELAARYSIVDLNDQVTKGVSQTTTGGVFGGKQQTYAVGLNWYPNSNVRFMLDYIHADVDKLGTNGVTAAGAHIDAVAARAQFAF
ncbi:MAG TPA: porin [Alphaproteobacteria bacterium]|jgi:phosphate-selective porin OprO/OprP|nr:porin [Alphaproteobacteria bacterium]